MYYFNRERCEDDFKEKGGRKYIYINRLSCTKIFPGRKASVSEENTSIHKDDYFHSFLLVV